MTERNYASSVLKTTAVTFRLDQKNIILVLF